MRKLLPVLLLAVAIIPIGVARAATGHHEGRVRQVTVPEADRFLPFAVTIRAGDAVKWTNGDGDDHTVVSDDAFNTAGHRGVDHLITALGGTFVLHFDRPGVFVYYCRFHATLDEFNQPIAPGPDGGIQNQDGNYGTPMSGVITVLPSD
jgi:plastocyanin